MIEFADDNFTFDENGRKLIERVENTVAKGEIARYEQFSFSHSVFKRLVLQTRKNQGLFEKGLTKLIILAMKGLFFAHVLLFSSQTDF